jgi:rhamnose transport system substrate-binding protein
LALIALVAVFAAIGCGSDDESSGAEGGATATEAAKDVKIAYLPKALNISYFTVAQEGAEKAAAEVGVDLKVAGPTSLDPSSQVPFINTLAQQGMDVILLAANDPNAIVPAMKRASDPQGTKFVTFDSDVAEGRSIFVNQVSVESTGSTLVKLISEQMGGTGKVAVLSGTSTSTNQNAWVDAIKAEMAKPEYSGLELVKVAYGDSVPEKATQETQALLQQFPDLGGIISPDAVGLPTAARVLDNKGKGGTVKLTGLALPSSVREYVKNGTIPSFGLWDVEKLGYLGFYASYNVATGAITGAEGETFEAGELGEYTVGANGEVVLGPMLVFTKENIDQYDF